MCVGKSILTFILILDRIDWKPLKIKGAVRQGFEPWVPFKGYNALAKRRFRPLSHLTMSLSYRDLHSVFQLPSFSAGALCWCPYITGMNGRRTKATEVAPAAKGKTRPLKHVGENLYRDDHGAYFTKFKVAGKRIKKKLKTADRVLAERRRDELRRAADRVRSSPGNRAMTFAELADQWVKTKAGEVKDGSLVRLRGIAAGLKREFGSVRVRDISRQTIEPWKIRRAKEIAPRTFNKELEALRQVFVYGMEVSGVVLSDPTEKITRIKKIDTHKANIPTKDQFRTLLAELRASPQASAGGAPDFAEFLAYSGLRVGEAVAVRVCDVSFKLDSLRVIPGKGHAERMVPLFPPLLALLRRLIAEPDVPHRRPFPFNEANGIRQALANACERAGLPHFTHHHLRHFFCSNAIEAGVDFKTIAAWLGHKDGGVLVARTYGHLRDVHSVRMAKLLTFSADDADTT